MALLHALLTLWVLWISTTFAIFYKKLPLAFHSSLFKQFLLFFWDLPYLGFCLVSKISLNFVIFSTSYNTLWNSMSPSCIACDMISAMLSNLLWASSLITSCFSCFLVNILKDLRVVDVWTEKIRLVPLNAIPTDWQHHLQIQQWKLLQ